ncbi:hypothetical protein GCM10025875_18780 [Litorihabitans aurantiacus]|uniref:ATP-dependent Clp protease ATP-binding subunit ClpX n=1 Tax=Litorihabitans aurantiacus TaxID=1930061 RepID=A0AA38CRF7_9MICO|nr:hypothetical protein GCM10025875_18780 [Litorihabitans aurantiacus]
MMFDIPGRDDVERVVITKECVTDGNTPTLVLRSPSAKRSKVREKTPA